MSVSVLNQIICRTVSESDRITELLHAVSRDGEQAQQALMQAVYEQLHAIARSKMDAESDRHTLQPTALINEAYPRLMAADSLRWRDRRHFLGAAAEAMRRVLVDHARRKNRAKREGSAVHISFDDALVFAETDSEELIALNAALDTFEQLDPLRAEVVKLKFFVGLPNGEIAESLNLSLRTVERHWTFAKSWLRKEMSAD